MERKSCGSFFIVGVFGWFCWLRDFLILNFGPLVAEAVDLFHGVAEVAGFFFDEGLEVGSVAHADGDGVLLC